MKIEFNKGRTVLNLDIPDEKILDILVGKDIPGLGLRKISRIIENGINNHSPKDISNKKTAIIIPDDTRLWARGDIFVPQIVKSLMTLGVPKDNITIIIALGTHSDMDKDTLPKLAGSFCAENIKILNSANKDTRRLSFIGDTRKKTALTITKEAAEADHIIIFGGVLHHMLAGFGGGRKYILPGIAGYDAIQQNHLLAIQKDGSPHPLVRQGILLQNPVNEDMEDAAHLFLKNKTCSYVAIAANGTGDIFHADVGDLDTTFISACSKLTQACCISVFQKSDFAIISTGGHRADTQLYQSTKALFNAINVVKQGGDILFIAGCSKGAGNDQFADTLTNFKHDPGKTGKNLVKKFNMPIYVALRVMDILKRFNVTLYSDFSQQDTLDLGFCFTHDIDHTIKSLSGKGFIIPFAENILPVLTEPIT
ncbi:MAG: nickel-dependent lactate racemase [Desulfobacula sp.]|nr:nickel-dependent lactate racemase [Desulfobacula sp.]